MRHPVEVRMLEALVPPGDYELECLVATTYSLDPSVLLAIISAATLEWNESDGSVGFDGLNKEECRRVLVDNRRKCLLYVDHHGPFDMRQNGLTALEKIVVDQVVKKVGRDSHDVGSLHTKFVLAMYKSSSGTVLGRLYIGSKNLTSSQNQEFGTVFELVQSSKRMPSEFRSSLTGFLSYLRETESIGVDSRRLNPLSRAIQLLASHKLEPLDSSLRFFWQGRRFGSMVKGREPRLSESVIPLLGNGWDQGFIYSPWARRSVVERIHTTLGKTAKLKVLCLKEPCLSTFKHENVRYQFNYSSTGRLQSHQSHAKIYYFTKGTRGLLIFGSANCTPDGWGLIETGTCKPNAEILVSVEVHSKDYRYLTNIVGAAEGIVAKPPKETEMELVLAFLNSIQVGVAYSPRNRALRYEIDSSRELSKVRRRVVITHELIEPIEGSHEECIEVWDGQPKATEVIKSWGKADLFRVSSLIRIACPSLEVETHLIVELDEQFYEGRSRLGVLKYSASEILSSLAQLMEVQIPDENTKKSEVAPSAVFGRQLHVLLDGLRLERYAYQMSRLKIREPNTFNTKKIRVDRLLDELRKNEELRAERSLDLFCESLDKIHGILS